MCFHVNFVIFLRAPFYRTPPVAAFQFPQIYWETKEASRYNMIFVLQIWESESERGENSSPQTQPRRDLMG